MHFILTALSILHCFVTSSYDMKQYFFLSTPTASGSPERILTVLTNALQEELRESVYHTKPQELNASLDKFYSSWGLLQFGLCKIILISVMHLQRDLC